MKVRKLNNMGVGEFEKYIDHLRRGNEQNYPGHLLDSDEYSEPINLDIEVDPDRQFESRFEIGQYLIQQFGDQSIQKHKGDLGFWSWLALLWFQQLCPKKKGSPKPSQAYNYILSKDYRHRPRHALFMTWQLVDLYGDQSIFMLGKEPSTRGELTEQLMARQEILYSRSAMQLANSLYYDPERKTFKKGVTSRNKGGTVTRFINWLDQLRLNFDIHSISSNDLQEMLPGEFDRFLKT